MIGSTTFNTQIPLTYERRSTQYSELDWVKAVSEIFLSLMLVWFSPANHPDHPPHPTNRRIDNNQQSKPRKYLSSIQWKSLPVKQLFRSLLPRLPTKQYRPLPSDKHLEGRKSQIQLSV